MFPEPGQLLRAGEQAGARLPLPEPLLRTFSHVLRMIPGVKEAAGQEGGYRLLLRTCVTLDGTETVLVWGSRPRESLQTWLQRTRKCFSVAFASIHGLRWPRGLG